MLYSILAFQLPGKQEWHFSPSQISTQAELANGVRLYFASLKHRPVTEQEAMGELCKKLSDSPIPWFVPGPRLWTLDLDHLAEYISKYHQSERPSWFTGRVAIRPTFEPGVVSGLDKPGSATWRGHTCFDITEAALKNPLGSTAFPTEIRDSIEGFFSDHPANTSTAFIMMRFVATPAHKKIAQAIQSCLKPFGIEALRADDKQYHPDLFSNVLTYIHACQFGIAVFERIENDEFNPNVSLEVGYMLALAKPVCFLKDRTLRTLPADVMGKLYRPFDPQSPGRSIPPALSKWCQDLNFIRSQL
jgi:hypothetical protein